MLYFYFTYLPNTLDFLDYVRFGGYDHRTCTVLGKITSDNIKGRNCEYALRCDPNAKKGKNFELWNEFMKYEVEYEPENF